MTGREGSAIVVNGLPHPRIGAQAGTLEHWRFINASPSRYYALTLDGHALDLIGSDGGRLDRPHPIDELVLAPGERAEVLLALSATNSTQSTVIATLDVGGTTVAAPQLTAILRSAADPSPDSVVRTRDVTLSMNMGMGKRPRRPVGASAHPVPRHRGQGRLPLPHPRPRGPRDDGHHRDHFPVDTPQGMTFGPTGVTRGGRRWGHHQPPSEDRHE